MKNKFYKIIIAGGGTGGHLFPAIALGDKLTENGVNVKYIGSKYGIENNYRFISKNNIELLDITGFQRSFSLSSLLKNILLPFRIIKSFLHVNKVFNKFQPDFVIGTGGYSCAIPLFLAIKKKILTGIQEQNVIPGAVTTFFARKVNVVFTSFKETNQYLDNSNSIHTGNPIRSNISNVNSNFSKEKYGLNIKKFTILIIGGSQGAASINNHFLSNYQYYTNNDIQIIWQTGKQKIESMNHPNIKIHEFIDDMGEAYSASDLVISRAGATAISEMIFLGKPSILIPYPFAANNHQEMNAKVLEESNASIMIKEGELKNGRLEKLVFELFNSKTKLNFMQDSSIAYSIKDSAEQIKQKIIMEINNARKN